MTASPGDSASAAGGKPQPAGYVVEPARDDHHALLAADDARWDAAPAIAWGAAPFATRFRALWAPDVLYVRFDADDTSPWFTKALRDAPIWEEEVVEIFLDPAGRGDDVAGRRHQSFSTTSVTR